MSLQTNPYFLREALLYFAKYPEKTGLLKSLFRIGSTTVSGYDQLKTDITNAAEELVPGIVNFLFSANEDKLKEGIEDTKGVFMLLDYGQISSSKDDRKRQNDQFELGIIIARKMKPESYDMAETLLLMDEMLNLLREVRQQMITDSKCSPFVKQLDFSQRIDPWYARELSNATGWSMSFTKTGIDLL